jgi:hypothetical protein
MILVTRYKFLRSCCGADITESPVFLGTGAARHEGHWPSWHGSARLAACHLHKLQTSLRRTIEVTRALFGHAETKCKITVSEWVVFVCMSVPVIMGVAEQIPTQHVLLVLRVLSLCHI